MKKYVLMTIEKDLKHDGFERHHFKLFESHFELQKHLKNFWYIEKNKYKVFEEIDVKRDYSLGDIKKV
jgi:hypothetical protein